MREYLEPAVHRVKRCPYAGLFLVPLDGCTPDKLLMVPAGREEVNKHRDRLSLAQTEDRYIVYKKRVGGAKG